MTDQQLVAVMLPREVVERVADDPVVWGIGYPTMISAAAKEALANPGVTVEGEVWRPNAESTGFITEGTTVPVGFPEGTCLVTVTSIKEGHTDD